MTASLAIVTTEYPSKYGEMYFWQTGGDQGFSPGSLHLSDIAGDRTLLCAELKNKDGSYGKAEVDLNRCIMVDKDGDLKHAEGYDQPGNFKYSCVRKSSEPPTGTGIASYWNTSICSLAVKYSDNDPMSPTYRKTVWRNVDEMPDLYPGKEIWLFATTKYDGGKSTKKARICLNFSSVDGKFEETNGSWMHANGS
mmetsp:Transcript_5421/g.7844  ORF Transcript_5421/g.7844 Transcript_5421/m.7844 type:complete len:195 (+) Transcript_5421:86-670(+)